MNKEDNNFFVIKNFFNDLYMKYTTFEINILLFLKIMSPRF